MEWFFNFLPMPLKATLNTDIAAALRLLQSLEPLPARYAFLTQALPGLQAAAADVALDDSELVTAADEERIDQIAEQIDVFVSFLRDGYRVFVGDHAAELPAWLNRFQKKQADYYTELIAGLGAAPADFRAKVTMNGGLSLEQLQTLHSEYLQLQSKYSSQKQHSQRVRDAIDLRFGLIGLLRMVGMPAAEIRERLAGE